MQYLRNAVLATLAYYDIFDFPLTLQETYAYLIQPRRLAPASRGEKLHGDGEDMERMSISDVLSELERLVELGMAGEQNGFYFLGGRADLPSRRIAWMKISDVKWRSMLGYAKWFAAVPYIRAVFVSGSLAMDNADRESDFDMLIIARKGRLYTCRMLLSGLTSCMGVRRTRYQRTAPDKFCFNHYLTDAHPYVPYHSVYNAETYGGVRPIYSVGGVAEAFFRANGWLEQFLYEPRLAHPVSLRTIRANPVVRTIARFGEALLNTVVGDWCERLFRWYQQRRIRKNPATHESGGRVIYDDTQLEFHPRSFEKTVIERYNTALERLGIVPLRKEEDSGLVKG